VLAVADAMETLGWHMERQQKPDSIHLSLMPPHANTADQFLTGNVGRAGSCFAFGQHRAPLVGLRFSGNTFLFRVDFV